MTTPELLDYHTTLCNKAKEIMSKKNHDYSGSSGETPFANLEIIEHLGLGQTELGILLRIADKLMRLATYIKAGKLLVEDEGVENSCLDAINYLVLFAAKVNERKGRQQKSTLSYGQGVLDILKSQQQNYGTLTGSPKGFTKGPVCCRTCISWNAHKDKNGNDDWNGWCKLHSYNSTEGHYCINYAPKTQGEIPPTEPSLP